MPSKKINNKKNRKKDYIYALGRRKTATARVRLFLKKGPNMVNGQPAETYFPGILNQTKFLKPFKITKTSDKFSTSIKVEGSGKVGQLEAAVHGLSRALAAHDSKAYQKSLRDAGLLTRDSRMKERRKVGTGGKARRQKQSPKR